MRKISCLLVANRGEIAVRIIRACRELGIKVFLAVSEVDRESLPARRADRVICIGPFHPSQSYLRVETIIMAALGTGAEAIHPGYGFLAEQPELAKACEQHGLIFIGPKSDQIRQMGDKIFARKMAESFGIPVIPGSNLIQSIEEALVVAKELGFPVLLKAAAGGGGRGMKIVWQPEDLKILYNEATAEALAAFGDSRLYIERFIPKARHIEVQIMGDKFGNYIHLGERDCSLQRRYQKMLEEAPAPTLSSELRIKICNAALDFAHRLQYENAGTIEFIFNPEEKEFYFLEMNTRIQVEHPVTEMITGIDLVKEQIRVASGEPLNFSQKDITFKGHSVECRINAESPKQEFRPCPGKIESWEPPQGERIRVDTHCYEGYFVPPYYDSLLAKVITWGEDRLKAITEMQKALESFTISGVETTLPFQKALLRNSDFIQSNVYTRWVEDIFLKEFMKNV